MPATRRPIILILGALAVVAVGAIALAAAGGATGGSTTVGAADVVVRDAQPVGGGGARGGPPPGGGAEGGVRAARPVGGVRTVRFRAGRPIALPVSSDTADEIHSHGYDGGKDVRAGGKVRFRMPATIQGTFEVELEQHKQQIARVEVLP